MSQNPFKNTIAVSLGFHAMGNRRGVSKATLKIIQQSEEVPKEMLAMSKQLLDSKELKAIFSADNKLVGAVKDMSVPSFLRKGTYLVPLANVEKVDAMIKKYMEETRPALCQAFFDKYDKQVVEAKEKLGPLYDRNQYRPLDQVKQLFWVDYRWDSFAPPDELATISPAIYADAKARMEERMEEVSDAVKQAMRSEMVKMVDTLHNSLVGKSKDGKPMRFYESGIENLNKFFDNFAARNVVSDDDLEAIVADARKLLTGVDAKYVRNDEVFRQKLGEQMVGIKEKLDGMTVAKVRKFDFSQESEEDAA